VGMNDFIIPPEIFYKFNDLKFIDKTHQYFLNKKQLTSVTTYIHKFQEKFDSDYWSLRKAEELGISQAEMVAEWKAINLKSQVKGSAVHNYIENLFNNKIFPFPTSSEVDKATMDEIHEEFIKIRYHIDRFYADVAGKLIPIKNEYVMYDEELGIAGMTDMLFYNVKYKCFQVWDWKTNKQLRTENSFQKLKGPLAHLDDCEINIYSLQLHIYKYILKRQLGIELGDCYIVWFNEKNNNYKIHQCYNFETVVPTIFQVAA
jgi:hypothetical protein